MSRILPMKTSPVEGIGAGQEAWLKLNNGPTYQQLVIRSNIKPSLMEKISIDLSGVHDEGVIWEATGEELVTKDKFLGQFSTDASPYFYLVELGQVHGKVDVGQMFSGLVTLPTDNIRVLFELSEGGTGAELFPASPFISVTAYASESQSVRQFIPYLRPQTILVNEQDSEVVYTSLPTRDGLAYRRLWLDGDISQVEIKKDGNRKYFGEKENVEYMQSVLKRAPQAGVFVVDFVERGYVLADLYNPAYRNSHELIMQVGAAENIRCVIEGVRKLPEAAWQR